MTEPIHDHGEESMAKFTHPDGPEYQLRLRNIGHLESLQDKYVADVEAAFMDDGQKLGQLLYGSPRRFAAILADLAGLDGEAAKKFVSGMDRDGLERGRSSFLLACANFFLPPPAATEFEGTVANLLAQFGGSAGSTTPTASPAASAA